MAFGGGAGGLGRPGRETSSICSSGGAPKQLHIWQDVNYSLSPFLDAVQGTTRRINLYDKSLDVRILPGTDGQTLRLKAQACPAWAAAVPAMPVEVQVDKHRFFERDGNDIFLDVPVSLAEAVLGGKITVPTIDGSVSVTAPAAQYRHDAAPAGQGRTGAPRRLG